MSLDDDELPEQYFCEQCRPDLHQDLLEKVERGERPWEERERQRQQEEEENRARKRKGGKKGKKGRPSNIKPETEPEPAKTNGASVIASTTMPPPTATEPEPRKESPPKRKFPDDAMDEGKSPSQQVRPSIRLIIKPRLTRSRNPRLKYAKFRYQPSQSLPYQFLVANLVI